MLRKSTTVLREHVRTRNIGWKTKLLRKGYTFYLAIAKIVAVGNALRPGQELYCYEADDKTGRPVLLAYLDGQPKDPTKEITLISSTTFIQHSKSTR